MHGQRWRAVFRISDRRVQDWGAVALQSTLPMPRKRAASLS